MLNFRTTTRRNPDSHHNPAESGSYCDFHPGGYHPASVYRDPRLVRRAHVLAAGHHGGLDPLAPVAGEALDREHGDRHCDIVSIMAARVTLKGVNDELARRGHHARLEKASGYFYFWSEDAAGWIDRTVRVEKISALTLDQWVGEFLRLKKLNAEMMGKAADKSVRVRKRT
jgi:hypothetical protein